MNSIYINIYYVYINIYPITCAIFVIIIYYLCDNIIILSLQKFSSFLFKNKITQAINFRYDLIINTQTYARARTHTESAQLLIRIILKADDFDFT